jgi:glycosyltransferase involved in cell wall biosynthesis
MRIVVILSSLYTGGAEFSTLTFYGWLLKQGHSVKLICYKCSNPSYDPVQFGFENVEYLPKGSFINKVKSLNAIIKSFNPQLVHSVLFEANILTRFSRVTSGNFVHLESLVNETYSSFRLSDPNINRLKLEAYRLFDKLTQRCGVDHFHANGISVATHYQKKLGIRQERMTMVQRGRESNPYVGDHANREKVRRELQTENRKLIMHVARHEYQKGQDVLLRALEKLEPWKSKIQLVLVGREGKLTPHIEESIQKYGLQSIVVLLGHRQDVSSLLAAADIFVFPSRFEGLPGALIEAEAAGLPLICSNIPNNREVASEKNALFFEAEDAPALANCIERILADEMLQHTMGKESLAIFKNKFSIGEVHQRMLSMLQKLIPSK